MIDQSPQSILPTFKWHEWKGNIVLVLRNNGLSRITMGLEIEPNFMDMCCSICRLPNKGEFGVDQPLNSGHTRIGEMTMKYFLWFILKMEL